MQVQTGSRGVVVNTGLASADIGEAAKESESANSTSSHLAAADHHDRQWGNHQQNPKAMAAHEEAAETHRAAYRSLKAKGKQSGGGYASKLAREASVRANGYK